MKSADSPLGCSAWTISSKHCCGNITTKRPLMRKMMMEVVCCLLKEGMATGLISGVLMVLAMKSAPWVEI